MTEAAFQPVVPIEESLIGVIGLEVDPTDEIGVVTARMPVAPKVCQPLGIVHGGAYAVISETLASLGTAAAVRSQGHIPLGQSNDTSFLRPITEGTVHAVARALHRGRTTWVWDVEMRNDEGKLCAVSRVTIAVR